MGLNNFKINNITASNLYQEGITLLTTIPPQKTFVKNSKIKIVIILNTTVNREYTDWLEKVLAYCKLSINDATILAFEQGQNIEEIENSLQPSQIWLFGISSNALGIKSIKTQHFEATHYQNLICIPLPRIEVFFEAQMMKENKRALMSVLKKVFSIV